MGDDEAGPNLVVPIKQVPDMEEVEFDREKGRIDRSSARAEPNPFDLNALEEAIRFKEEKGGMVTVVSMGPPQAESTLRDALARGADEVILLTDKAFAGADTWATATTLYAAVREVEDFDLILCGEKTVDGDTGQVGPELAELLGIPHVAYVSEIMERNDSSVKVASEVWGRTYVRELEFPGLITVTKDVNVPRLPTLEKKLESREAEIEEWGIDNLKETVDEEDVGLPGSPTSVNEIEIAPDVAREGETFRDEASRAVRKLISRLRDEGILREGGDD